MSLASKALAGILLLVSVSFSIALQNSGLLFSPRVGALSRHRHTSMPTLMALRGGQRDVDSESNVRNGQVDEDSELNGKVDFRDEDVDEGDEDREVRGSSPASGGATAKFAIAGAVCGISLLSSELAAVICLVLGIAFPAYLSLKALGTDGGENGQLQRLLAYWGCMGALQVAEAAVWPIVGGRVKHYNAARLLAICWMQGEGFARSVEIHERWLLPALQTHGGVFDAALKQAGDALSERVFVFQAAVGRAIRLFARALIDLKNSGAAATAGEE